MITAKLFFDTDSPQTTPSPEDKNFDEFAPDDNRRTHSNMGSIIGDDEDEVLRKSQATPNQRGKNRRKRSDMVADPKKVV